MAKTCTLRAMKAFCWIDVIFLYYKVGVFSFYTVMFFMGPAIWTSVRMVLCILTVIIFSARSLVFNSMAENSYSSKTVSTATKVRWATLTIHIVVEFIIQCFTLFDPFLRGQWNYKFITIGIRLVAEIMYFSYDLCTCLIFSRQV